jgi:maltokinase
VAALHRALATPSSVFPTPVLTAGPETVASWKQRALATLDDALEVAVDAVRPRLHGLAERTRAALDLFDAVERTPVMRIHGDLHVGQVLRWDGGYAVSDFDGNPLAPPESRVAPDAPARDVASMARAIDHVGRVVQRRRPGREADVEVWMRQARGRFLDAYRAGLGDDARLYDERLLHPLEVAQECHEHLYAARYLPRWAYVPDIALPALLEDGR